MAALAQRWVHLARFKHSLLWLLQRQLLIVAGCSVLGMSLFAAIPQSKAGQLENVRGVFSMRVQTVGEGVPSNPLGRQTAKPDAYLTRAALIWVGRQAVDQHRAERKVEQRPAGLNDALFRPRAHVPIQGYDAFAGTLASPHRCTQAIDGHVSTATQCWRM